MSPLATDGLPRPRVRLTAAYAWRFLVIAAAVGLVVWIAGQMLLVVVPVGVALIVARALWPVSDLLQRRGLPPALASLIALFGLLLAFTIALGVVGAALAGEFDQLRPTVEAGVDDVTDWLVADSPFDVSRNQVDDIRQQAEDAISTWFRSGGEGVVSGAVVAVEILAGALLALVITFFLVKDGLGWVRAALGRLPPPRRGITERCLRRAWDALGGFLRGVVILGSVEGVTIGLAMCIVGSGLVAPVVVLTFLGAFVPIVGATVAGVVAVLVTLVTAGTGPALVVAVVAIAVQQFDNDLLAPVIYGRVLRLHPLTILLGIATGTALFGFVGTVFAVPVLAVVLNALDEWRTASGTERDDAVVGDETG
jgi:predicted PurR-regulated permease PerM